MVKKLFQRSEPLPAIGIPQKFLSRSCHTAKNKKNVLLIQDDVLYAKYCYWRDSFCQTNFCGTTTARTGQPGKSGQGRTAMIGLSRTYFLGNHNSLDRTARKERTGQDSHDRSVQTEQPRQDCQDRTRQPGQTVRIGQPEQNKHDRRYDQDSTYNLIAKEQRTRIPSKSGKQLPFFFKLTIVSIYATETVLK